MSPSVSSRTLLLGLIIFSPLRRCSLGSSRIHAFLRNNGKERPRRSLHQHGIANSFVGHSVYQSVNLSFYKFFSFSPCLPRSIRLQPIIQSPNQLPSHHACHVVSHDQSLDQSVSQSGLQFSRLSLYLRPVCQSVRQISAEST